MRTQLLALPNELLVLILAFLPLRSITSCKRTCRHLRAVIKQSGLLRCRIRTMKNYIENLSPPGLSTSDFLENLRIWEKAWLTFGVGKEAATQTLFRPFQGFSEFLVRSGYLIQMGQGDRCGWSYVDLSLQPHLRGKRSAVRWTDVQLEVNLTTRGWALDIDQDLVAISCLS
jgi:F-box-like